VASVIGEKGKLVLAGRHADDEIEVGDALSRCAQATPLFPEKLACFFIDTDKGNAPQEIVQTMFALQRIAGVVYSFPQFGERDGREREPLPPQFLHAPSNSFIAV
jgi:hypothetical protein